MTTMRERGILMTATNVRAILAGTKTQTRRKVAFPRKRDAFVVQDDGNGWWPYQSDDGESAVCNDGCEHPYACPYGVPGDRLWVRETWAHDGSNGPPWYRADRCARDFPGVPCEHGPDRWRPSIFMPRWASRLTLEIAAVRVERLQEISDADCFSEGIQQVANEGMQSDGTARGTYRALWESINAPGSWDVNPYVWVIEFTRAAAEIGRG